LGIPFSRREIDEADALSVGVTAWSGASLRSVEVDNTSPLVGR
jgi:hypothetical protein